jgi:fibronectin type 3 domain-containing protein
MESDFRLVKQRRAALIAALVAVAAVIGVFAYTKLQSGASHSVTLRWSPSPGATSYNVYRSRVSGVRGSQIGISSTPTYIDRAVPGGTTFYYTVTGVRDGRESGPSNEAKAVIP